MPAQRWPGLIYTTTGLVYRHSRDAKLTSSKERDRISGMIQEGRNTHPTEIGRNLVAQRLGTGRFATALPTQLSVTNLYCLTLWLWYRVFYSMYWIFISLGRFSQPFLPPLAFTTQEGKEVEEKAANWRECGCEGVYMCFGFKASSWKEIFALRDYKRGMIYCTEKKVRSSCNVTQFIASYKGRCVIFGR